MHHFYFILLSFTLLLFGCTKSQKKSPHILSVGISSIPTHLDPRLATDAEGMKIGGLVFQSLVKIGPDMNIVGDAAHSWSFRQETTAKGTLYKLSFDLKPDLKFSTGQAVECKDILYSIKEFQSSKSPFKSAFQNIIQSECHKQTVLLTLNSYSEKVLNSDLPVIKILPASNESEKRLVGSGPFQIENVTETLISLVPNPYYTSTPKIPQIDFKVIKDDFTRFLKMYKGDLDLAISSLPKNKIRSLEKVKRLKVIQKPGLKMAYLLLNFKNPLLADHANRQLIFQALNRDEIIQYKLEGLAQKASSILPPSNPFFFSQMGNHFVSKTSPSDLRQAVLNSEISKTVLRLKTSNNREAVENAKLISNQLRQAGFRIQHESYEWGTFYKDIQSGQYDLATMTWVGAYDPDIYRIALSSTEFPPHGRNRGYYKNAVFDQLVEQGASELNPEARKKLYEKVQQIAYKDLAIIPLWYEDTITVIDERVQNYRPSLNGDYSGLISAQLKSDSTND